MSCYSRYAKISVALSIYALIGCQAIKDNPFVQDQHQDVQSLVTQDKQLQVSSQKDAVAKAREAWAQGKKDLAQVLYVKAFDLDPNNVELLAEMAERYRELDKPDLVAVCYRMILEKQPKHPVQEKYGLLLLEQHKFDEAEQVLQKALAAGAKSWQAHNGLGIIADIKGNHDKAKWHFQQALTIRSNEPEILNNLGYSFYMSGQLDKAQGFFSRALQADPGFKKALYNQALVEARRKNYQNALAMFAKVVNSAEAHNNVGYSAMMNGDFAEADYYLNQALKLSPTFYQKAYDNLQSLNARKAEKISP